MPNKQGHSSQILQPGTSGAAVNVRVLGNILRFLKEAQQYLSSVDTEETIRSGSFAVLILDPATLFQLLHTFVKLCFGGCYDKKQKEGTLSVGQEMNLAISSLTPRFEKWYSAQLTQ